MLFWRQCPHGPGSEVMLALLPLAESGGGCGARTGHKGILEQQQETQPRPPVGSLLSGCDSLFRKGQVNLPPLTPNWGPSGRVQPSGLLWPVAQAAGTS